MVNTIKARIQNLLAVANSPHLFVVFDYSKPQVLSTTHKII